MAKTVSRPKTVPIAPLWFENIQLANRFWPVPGPQLPRGSKRG